MSTRKMILDIWDIGGTKPRYQGVSPQFRIEWDTPILSPNYKYIEKVDESLLGCPDYDLYNPKPKYNTMAKTYRIILGNIRD